MLNVDEYVQTYVSKPNQLQAYNIALEIWDLLVALNEKGYVREQLRGKRTLENREMHVSIAKNADGILASLNKFYGLYFDEGKNHKFLDLMYQNGLLDNDLIHILNVQLIFDFLLDSESFKNILNLMLQNIKPKRTLGQLFSDLTDATQQTGEAKKITNRINVNLRNSLAHFLFREEGTKIFYYKQEEKEGCSTLKEFTIKSSELLEKTREVSLMRAILACMIVDWYALPSNGKT